MRAKAGMSRSSAVRMEFLPSSRTDRKAGGGVEPNDAVGRAFSPRAFSCVASCPLPARDGPQAARIAVRLCGAIYLTPGGANSRGESVWCPSNRAPVGFRAVDRRPLKGLETADAGS